MTFNFVASPFEVQYEVDGFREHSILCIGMLNLFGFARFLGFVQHCLQRLAQTSTNNRVICNKTRENLTSNTV